MTCYIAPVVEGDTETGCVERLLQRIWVELLAAPVRLQVVVPSRGSRASLVHPNRPDLAEKIEEARTKLVPHLRKDPTSRARILVLLDADNDCPAELAPRLLTAAKSHHADADIACVLAKRMFENWLVGGASALAGVNGLPDPLPARAHFEDRSGSKWLADQLRAGNPTRKYDKIADGLAFVRRFSLQECRGNCPSFDKLCRELETLLPPPDPPPAE